MEAQWGSPPGLLASNMTLGKFLNPSNLVLSVDWG